MTITVPGLSSGYIRKGSMNKNIFNKASLKNNETNYKIFLVCNKNLNSETNIDKKTPINNKKSNISNRI